MMGVVIRNFEKNLRGVLSSCTSSQEPLQMTKIYTQANQWLLNKERITMVISLWTGTPGQNPKRYQDPVLWAWPESFSPLRSINSKTTHYLLPYIFVKAPDPNSYNRSFRCGPLEIEHPSRYQKCFFNPKRLVFTSNGVVIRSVEWYYLAKIKATESEAQHWFCLWLRRSWSSENYIVGVGSRSLRTNQLQGSETNNLIDLFFRFCFHLRQSSFHWIISDKVVNGIARNGNILILPTAIPPSLSLCLQLRFSILTRS